MKKIFSVGPQFHGNSSVIFAWQPNGNFVATVGNGQRNVYLFDRRGTQVEEIALKSTAKLLQMEWDKDGELLAMLQQGEPYISLWHVATRRTELIEMSGQDPSFMCWSKVGPQLAIGTAKGTLMMFNKRTMKKQTILGKHSKKITCGAWNCNNQLALGAEDKNITLSAEDGDTTNTISVKHEPDNVRFANIKTANQEQRRENTVSLVLGKQTLFLLNAKEPDTPVELAFQPKYGNIVSYSWFGDGYLVLGFSAGYLVIISSHMREIQEELSSFRFHSKCLEAVAANDALSKVASAGDGCVKVISTTDWKEIKGDRIVFHSETAAGATDVPPKVTKMHWSTDGQILTFATDNGWLHCYLAYLQSLASCSGSRLCYLTSLRELTILDCKPNGAKFTLTTDVEPTFVALGPLHCAAGMNNRVWFYSAHDLDTRLVNEQEYVGTVETVSLNDTMAAIQIDGRVYIHAIDPGGGLGTQIFPRQEEERGVVTCSLIQGDFLIYANNLGSLMYYSLTDNAEVNGWKHTDGIRRIFPNQTSTRVVIVDTRGKAMVYSPINDECVVIEDFPTTAEKVLWDSTDRSIFIAVDGRHVYCYFYQQTHCKGSRVVLVGTPQLRGNELIEAFPGDPTFTKLPFNHLPVMVMNLLVICQSPSGALLNVKLKCWDSDGKDEHASKSGSDRRKLFCQALAFNKFDMAFRIALEFQQDQMWQTLARRCLEALDFEQAKKAYYYIDAGMVVAIGCILLRWEQALQLAQTYAPHRLSDIYLKCARQFEVQNNSSQTISFYQQALDRGNEAAKGGLCRAYLRSGDISKGISLVNELNDRQLLKECAVILEEAKHNVEAAELYVKSENYEKAAMLYIADLNFTAAGQLMPKITTPKIHMQYAKAKESRGQYREALAAYEVAKDHESMIRLYLHVDEPQKALSLCRQTQLPSGAELVAEYCKKQGNIRSAVEFFLLANNEKEAFELATNHDEMDAFVQCIQQLASSAHAPPQLSHTHTLIAQYYENRSLLPQAAAHYDLAGDFALSLQLYLKCTNEKYINEAIEVVGRAQNDTLTHTLIDYLMGECDNVPKDPQYVYRLHQALGNYTQAASTALIIARQEQELGNYKVAHTLLFNTYGDLVTQKLPLPMDLWRRLMMLHSYVLVKRLVKISDHQNAAYMLLRVADNIHQFPQHVVPILTSVVIECQRAKLTEQAYHYACILMKQEHRGQISEQYRRKIESIVRKRSEKTENVTPPEPQSPCVYCGTMLPDYQLECHTCQNVSPFCICTGMHMVASEWSECPHCHFPAKHFALVLCAEGESVCPMCERVLAVSLVPPVVTDVQPHLQRYKAMFKKRDE
eukprot:GEMP01002130.1.p1 GENE.GEMP01002130.1~~GEMP01002130.1.p1  ORF type:complete len:1334 (+),score=291.61 GEMP01002130.1:56-4057(+)